MSWHCHDKAWRIYMTSIYDSGHAQHVLFCIMWALWPTEAGHHSDAIMTTMASQITSLTIVYSIVYSYTDQRKHQSSSSLAFVRGIHRGPVNSPHKGPVTRKMFPFDDVIMDQYLMSLCTSCSQNDTRNATALKVFYSHIRTGNVVNILPTLSHP